MARNDAHSPLNLVTEDYDYLGSVDYGTSKDAAAGFMQVTKFVKERGYQFGFVHDRAQCDHCGARLRYAAWLVHLPTGKVIEVGETCLDNRFGRATADFQALRKQAELDREAHRIKGLIAEFVDANPDLAFMADKNHEHTNDFVADVARKLRLYGSLSERQVEAVRRAVKRDSEPVVEAPKVPVVTGKVTISGEVKSVKVQYSDFGSTLKMLVLDDRGFKVWGTVPASLQDGIDRGTKVQFNATVEASRDDESFGFFKRPTKAVFIDNQEEAE